MLSSTTTYDLKRADEIYGKDVAILKGRMTRTKDLTLTLEYMLLPLISNLVMHADVMFISGQPYLLTTTKPICLVMMVTNLEDERKYLFILEALEGQIGTYRKRGFFIEHTSSDKEGVIAKIQSHQGNIVGGLSDATININMINFI